jgi:hypothetical protein
MTTFFERSVPGNVPAFLGRLHPEQVHLFPFALVTCLDSSRDVAGTVRVSTSLGGVRPLGEVGQAVLFSTVDLRDATSAQSPAVLFGFDEVWLCGQRPATCPPESVNLVGECGEVPPQSLELQQWMDAAEAFFGLGDGCGRLNQVVALNRWFTFLMSVGGTVAIEATIAEGLAALDP